MTVWVGHIPESVNDFELTSILSKCGKIINVDRKKSYAFIDYEKRENGQKAVELFNGMRVADKVLRVELSNRATGNSGPAPGDSKEKCYVCNVVGHVSRHCRLHSNNRRQKGAPVDSGQRHGRIHRRYPRKRCTPQRYKALGPKKREEYNVAQVHPTGTSPAPGGPKLQAMPSQSREQTGPVQGGHCCPSLTSAAGFASPPAAYSQEQLSRVSRERGVVQLPLPMLYNPNLLLHPPPIVMFRQPAPQLPLLWQQARQVVIPELNAARAEDSVKGDAE